MKKCFITKLPAEVNNDDLPIYGKFNINFKPLTSGTDKPRRGVRLAFNKDAELKVVGKGYFTNADKSQNLGTTLSIKGDNTINSIYVSDEVSRISVDKYTLTFINGHVDDTPLDAGSNTFIDIQDIKYANLTNITLPSTNVTGDISALSGLTNLTSITLSGTNVTGDISALSDLTKLNNITMYNATSISGDISALSGLTNLTSIGFANNKFVSGDISSLSGLTNLANINLVNISVTGDISSLSGLTNLTNLILINISVTGDISSLSGRTSMIKLDVHSTNVTGDATNIVNNLTKLTYLTIPKAVTITDEQVKTLTDRGCTLIH